MMSKWRWAGPPRSPQGCPPLTPKPFTRLPLSAGVSGDSGDPGPLLQGSSQARLPTRPSSQVALGFCPHTFGDRKNTLDRKKGALPWWISLIHCPCCHPPLLLGTQDSQGSREISKGLLRLARRPSEARPGNI